MSGKSSSGNNKQKATAREHATQHMHDQGQQSPQVPTGHKEISQGRFPGETPLTGEDRPADRPGGKKQGQLS